MEAIAERRVFLGMKIGDLKGYLRARGVVVGQEGHVELAERAYWASKLGLAIKATDKEAENAIDVARKSKLDMDGGMVRLPRPESLQNGWEMSPASLPDTTRDHIDSYIRTTGRKVGLLNTEGVKTLGLGKSLYMSHHVQEMSFHGINPNISYCFVRAKVIPQTSTSSDRYFTWVVLNKDNGQIITGECNCTIGIQGACKHIAAVLFAVAEALEQGRNLSSTSQKMAWSTPSKGKVDHEAKFVEDMRIVKVKSDTSMQGLDQSARKVYRSNYDPRAVAHRVRRPITDFDLDKLAEVTNGKTGLLMYNKLKSDPSKQTPNLHDIGSQVEVSTTHEAPTVQQSLTQSIGTCCPSLADQILEDLKISPHQQAALANATSTQALSPNWHKHRKGRITASVAAECATKVTGDPPQITPGHSCLARVMGYYGQAKAPSLQWGRDMEQIAQRHYIAHHKLKYKHSGVSCKETGLWVNLQYPFLAASPDGIISCKSCENGQPGLIEIKNPYTNRFISIKELVKQNESSGLIVENGVIHLNRNHKYFTQVQVQLHSIGYRWCDFVVHTVSPTDNIHIERIYLDNNYLYTLFPKFHFFFTNAIVPELLNRNVQDIVIGNAVKNAMKSMLDKLSNADASRQSIPYPCGLCGSNCEEEPSNMSLQSIGCDTCQMWHHYSCLGLTGNEAFLRKRKSTWKCDRCKKTSRKRKKADLQ